MDKPSPDSTHKFLTLDMLRGVAALVVVEFHFVGSAIVTHGYLAVDFFFLLSGFVLALAYQSRLDAGWSTWSFFKVRLIRLYPLYILGMALGLGTAIGFAKFGPATQSLRPYAILAGLAVLMLPHFASLPLTTAVVYPLDVPAWSLIVEIFANVFHGMALRRRSDRFLAGVVVVAGLLMLASLKVSGTVAVGENGKYLVLAIPRILFSYTLGMLLFRVWKRGRLRFHIPFLLSPVLLILLLMTPWCGGHVIRYDLMVIFFFFPLLLLASASSNPPASLSTVSLLLGRTSYAIYVLHSPLRELQSMALDRLARNNISFSHLVTQIVILLVSIAIALLVDRFYDDPVRAFLRRRFVQIKRIKAIPPMPISM